MVHLKHLGRGSGTPLPVVLSSYSTAFKSVSAYVVVTKYASGWLGNTVA